MISRNVLHVCRHIPGKTIRINNKTRLRIRINFPKRANNENCHRLSKRAQPLRILIEFDKPAALLWNKVTNNQGPDRFFVFTECQWARRGSKRRVISPVDDVKWSWNHIAWWFAAKIKTECRKNVSEARARISWGTATFIRHVVSRSSTSWWHLGGSEKSNFKNPREMSRFAEDKRFQIWFVGDTSWSY